MHIIRNHHLIVSSGFSVTNQIGTPVAVGSGCGVGG